MEKRFSVVAGQIFLVGACVLPVAGVNAAAVLEKFSPYAFGRVLNDSNVFRSNNNEEDDTISHLGAGLKTDVRFSQQHLLVDAVVDRSFYDSFDQLDHTRVDANGTLALKAGRQWTGNVGYGYNRRLSSFNEQLVRQKDMRTTHTGFASAAYQLNLDWSVGGGLDYSDVSYEERSFLDRNITGGQVETLYRNTLNTRVGVRLRYTDYDLRNSLINNISISNDFSETTLSGLFFWDGTGQSSLELSAGFTDVRYDDLNDRDFQGGSGRITYYWVPGAKTQLNASVWQEISTLDNEITSYVLSRGGSLEPSWHVTSKVELQGAISYSNDDFKGDNEVRDDIGAEKRTDDVWMYRIGVVWTPRDLVRVKLAYRRKDRDSTVDVRDFNDDQIDAEVRLNF